MTTTTFVTNAAVNSVINQCQLAPSKSRFTSEVDQEFLLALRKNVFPGQRNHGRTASRKSFLGGMLWGDQLTFTAVYVVSEKKTWIIDGNNRIERLGSTGSDASTMPAGESALLITHVVPTMEKADELYDMYNSLAAAKNSGDAFDSGLRKVDMLPNITSHLVCKGGRATGVQLAYGKKGSQYTTAATVALIKGIKAVNNYGLRKQKEIAGQLGSYFAIAQHTFDARLAYEFIRDCNMRTFSPIEPTERDVVMLKFRKFVELRIQGQTGGKVNDAVFSVALKNFVDYSMASNRSANAEDVAQAHSEIPEMTGISLAAFIEAMAALKTLKGL